MQGHHNPMDGIQPAVKSALTKAYKKGSDSRVVRSADLIALPGLKKAPKKRIAAILEPVENGVAEENEEALVENEEENSDAEDAGKKLLFPSTTYTGLVLELFILPFVLQFCGESY